MNVLIAVCGSPALAPNLTSMLRDIDYIEKIVGIDINSDNAGRFLIDRYYKSPKTDSDSFIPFVKDVCIKEDIDIILCTSTQNSLIPLKQVEKDFNKIGVKIPGVSIENLLVANDKGLMLDRISELNIQCPKYCTPKNEKDFDNFINETENVIVKPRVSSGSRGFRILRKGYKNEDIFSKVEDNIIMDIDEYKKILVSKHNVDDIVMMEKLTGQDYSVYVLANNGNPLVTVPLKRLNPKQGVSLVSEVDLNDIVIDYVNKIVKEMSLDWIVNIQLFLNEEGIPLVYEINPRLAGSIILTKGAGCNLLKYGLDMISGKDSKINKPKSCKMIRYYTEVLV